MLVLVILLKVVIVGIGHPSYPCRWQAARKYRENEEKARLRETRQKNMYTLDPLMEQLMSYSSDQVSAPPFPRG